ncbi:hypothetical protein WJX72_000021 [[Myrmecia] bisecta]|uniref:Protein FAM136A n=1 Tax=[Myrmecia] bisecta TaxID=41462 RepID=A0AAW1P8S1_9CHLO
MSSPEERAAGVSKALTALVEDLEKSELRPRQKDSFVCSARCCDSSASQQNLQQCCEACSTSVRVAEQVVNRSLATFQERLQRCAQRCSDVAQESMPTKPSDKDIAKAQGRAAECLADCAQQYEQQVPKLGQDIRAQLQQAAQR